jgi:hypothetical protein
MLIRVGSLLAVVGLVGTSMVGLARQTRVAETEYQVMVRTDSGGEPGVPLSVSIKTQGGKTIAEARTDSSGKARFRLTTAAVPLGSKLEVLLDLGAGRTVGSIDTLKPECNFYQVFLPRFELNQCHGTIEFAK